MSQPPENVSSKENMTDVIISAIKVQKIWNQNVSGIAERKQQSQEANWDSSIV